MALFTLRGVRAFRCGVIFAAAGTALAGTSAATAQTDNFPPGAVVQSLPERDSGADLRRHLTTLAENPRSLSALVGAGRAALEMNDFEAAIGFFDRAEEIAPRDARVKAGMASALVRMEQGQAAIALFADALALGAPILEIAADRGLAYDLVGNPGLAQQDYTLVLRSRDDPEVRKRLALSLAISGQRDAALALIDAQLRRHDRAAWRTRALILALTGDVPGAQQAALATMPAQAAQAMAPFLARFSALAPDQKAAAVHFGRFPSNPRPMRMASTANVEAYPGAVALAEGRAIQAGTAGLKPRNPPAEPVSREPRRRPGAEGGSVRTSRRRAETASPNRRQPAQARQNTTKNDGAAAADGRDFGEVAALVSDLPLEQVQQTAFARAAGASETGAAAVSHPSRHWVQIAGGANKASLPREFARLKGMAPELLEDHFAWTTPLRSTNRLLVGPFSSGGEAQEFVNRLSAKDVAAFAWTSPAGQEIERLSARQ